jgi:predicted ribosome quality control (RQC) complex YloA/Tae2 family protein
VSLLPGGRYALPEGKVFEVKNVRDFADVKGKTLNERVVRHFYQSIVSDGFGAEKNSWLQSVRAARKKIETAVKNAEKDATKADDADSLRAQAMALSERLYELGPKKVPHLKKIELERMENGEKITITLDPSRSYSENAEQLFKKAKKMDRTQQEMAERSSQLNKKLVELDEILELVEKSEASEDLEKISSRLRAAGISPPKLKNEQNKKVKPQEPKDFLEVESSDGFLIICGRNQIENRAVTFKSSKGADIWMHLKGVPGAHVVIKALKNKTVPLSTLLEAAQLTLYYSKIRNGKKADVDYTFRKNVKPIKGTVAEVTYTDNKTLYVKADSEVIKRLLREVTQ